MPTTDPELTELRERVDCRTVLERAGWELDVRESTPHSPKYRSGKGRIVILTHGGKGWFDPLMGKRGDVVALAQHLWGGTLGHARKALRPLAGMVPAQMPNAPAAGERLVGAFDAEGAWLAARPLRPGSQAWTYLTRERGLPPGSIDRAARAGVMREGIYGTMLALHRDAGGRPTGWEMRGPLFKGYSKGGAKGLFRVGDPVPVRVVAAEAAIDALSLATIEGWPEGTLYVSTGGGYGAGAEAALRALLLTGARLEAATDRGDGGEMLATRLREVAVGYGAGFARLRPDAPDWNDQLRAAGD